MRRYLLASSIVAFSAPAFAEPAIDPEVQKHFDLGNQLYAEGRYDDALVEYDKAYALSNNWKILFNRGQTLVMLRRDPDAIHAFEQYLERGGNDVPEERRAAVEQDLAKLRQRLAWITLSDAPPDAEVLVDGHTTDKTPLKKPLAVGAGKHVVALEKSNKIVFSKAITIAAGDTQNVVVVIAPEPKKEPPPAPRDEGGLPVHAFNIALALGIAAPMAQVARGRLDVLGNVELSGGWRIHPLWSVGAFIGGAAGQIELKSSVSTSERIDPSGRYSFGIGGIRGRLHLLRDRYFDGWLGVDLGVWRETWSFNPVQNSGQTGFEWAATSPAIGLAAGLDFPIARTWALGAAARVFGTAVRSGDRFGCGPGDNRCDSDDLPGGGGLGGRGFFEFVARLTWSIPYGGR
jgi:hypothetical protein